MTRASLLALILLLAGLILLWIFLIRLIRRLTYKPVEGKPNQVPPSVSFWSISLAVVVLSLSWIFFWMGQQLSSFKKFDPPGIIGHVEIVNEHDQIKTLNVNFFSMVDDSLGKPTSFYLTGDHWKLQGQAVRLPYLLKPVFNGQHFFKVTDFRGEYIGHKPPGFDSPLLAHQTIEGGMVDMFEYLGVFPYIRDIFIAQEFENEFRLLKYRAQYDIVLTDSSEISLLDSE